MRFFGSQADHGITLWITPETKPYYHSIAYRKALAAQAILAEHA
jgi:hypothetical protein